MDHTALIRDLILMRSARGRWRFYSPCDTLAQARLRWASLVIRLAPKYAVEAEIRGHLISLLENS